MVKADRKAGARFAPLVAGGALMLMIGAAGSAQTPAPGRGRGFQLPQQGFQATGQNPANYTPDEAAAVAVVQKWIETTNKHDLAAHMALVDDNVTFRGDPLEPLERGARGYCTAYGFVRGNGSVRIDELYVVGGPSETIVLMKRTDLNAPAGRGVGGLGGYPVPVGVLARVKNGKVTEWYDAPVNKVSIAALPFRPQLGPPQNIPAVCMPFPAGGQAQTRAPVSAAAQPQPPTYGTSKPEYWFNPDEASAALAVRGWFAAWKAGDALLLGAFVDRNVMFRPTSAADLGRGRDSLMRLVCGSVGDRLNLTDLFVVGGDFDTLVVTRWDRLDAAGKRIRMGSFFRVQKGLIVEWMDVPVDPAGPAAANQNSPACQAVNSALGPVAN